MALILVSFYLNNQVSGNESFLSLIEIEYELFSALVDCCYSIMDTVVSRMVLVVIYITQRKYKERLSVTEVRKLCTEVQVYFPALVF